METQVETRLAASFLTVPTLHFRDVQDVASHVSTNEYGRNQRPVPLIQYIDFQPLAT